MTTNIKIKTAQAADVVGISYEGFRTWLKKGLLKSTGRLAEFSAPDVPAKIPDAKRWKWSEFGFSDLCSFRAAKFLLDAGRPWCEVVAIASSEEFWRSHRSPAEEHAYLILFPTDGSYIFCSQETLDQNIEQLKAENVALYLINLQQLRQNTLFRIRSVLLKAVGDEIIRTSWAYVVDGSSVLPPEEGKAREKQISFIGEQVIALASSAERGADVQKDYNQLVCELQALGARPHASLGAALTGTFLNLQNDVRRLNAHKA
ncbi:hypothetical protein [Gluconobacter cerinus]|uniref:hypothetical protein n=1 Tax=Gluconobacter cerinus TaxID=38307 RepID=UPI001B8D572B|nr:hypothetical protein [Gluconobacter cerinus]MBS1067163.1 hypothetical protein [Gluconobacter cerinus]